jgi:hypothetical protein
MLKEIFETALCPPKEIERSFTVRIGTVRIGASTGLNGSKESAKRPQAVNCV